MLQWDGETWQPVPGLAGCNDPEAFNYTAGSDGSAACWSCEPVTFDGYTYSVIEVADQCWFAENLRSTHYNDGTPIPVEQGNDEWAASSSDLRCVHTANPTNETLYGQLYNFRAVTSPHGLCPSGWSVPSQSEWDALAEHAASLGYFPVAPALKAVGEWQDNPAVDAIGFAALPGGGRRIDGYFDPTGTYGYWWTRTPSGSGNVWYRQMTTTGSLDLQIVMFKPEQGMSVRCLRTR